MWNWGNAYIHILSVIVLTGYALFWSIMAVALARRVDAGQRRAYLQMIRETRWPPGGVPESLRIPLLGLGWLVLAVLLVTGLVLLDPANPGIDTYLASVSGEGRLGVLFSFKMLLVALVCAAQLLLSFRLLPGVMYTILAGTLCIIAASAMF